MTAFAKKLLLLLFLVISLSNSLFATTEPLVAALPDGKKVVLQDVTHTGIPPKDIDLREDIQVAILSFIEPYLNATEEELVENFGKEKNIESYYKQVFALEDETPFREGKLTWIRASIAGQFAGFISLQPEFHAKDRVYVSTLAVAPNFKNRGLGRMLLESVANHWFPNAEEVVLYVRKINHSAIRFYQRRNFRPWEAAFLPTDELCVWMRWIRGRE